MNRTPLHLMAFCALLSVSAIAASTSASAGWFSSDSDSSASSPASTATTTVAPAAPATATAKTATPASAAPSRQAQVQSTTTPNPSVAPIQAGTTSIRVVDGDSSASGVKIRTSEYRVVYGAASSYAKIPAGGAEISSGSSKIPADFRPDGHYSILLRKGTVNVVQDPVQDDKQRAQLILINVSSVKGVSLKNSPNEASDVGPTDPGALATAPINPINIGFGVYDSSNKLLASVPASPLAGGTAYAVVVYDGKDGKTAVSISKANM